LANIYDNIDLEWSWNGDFSLDRGELKDTSDDVLQSLRQDIHTISASALGDWAIHEGLGATLDDFIGEPNNVRTSNSLHDRLRISLISAGVVLEEDLSIRIIPVHINRVLIIIGVNAAATVNNDLNESEPIVVQAVYDSAEQQVFFLDKTPIQL